MRLFSVYLARNVIYWFAFPAALTELSCCVCVEEDGRRIEAMPVGQVQSTSLPSLRAASAP
jgi:hypothetical protein